MQCNTDSCCEHIVGGVIIYLYGWLGLLAFKCAVSVSTQNQSTNKKPYVLDLTKLDALLHKTHSKVLRY